ncbi:right-handed parallel beta-helix repeat-containing protein [Draconibacterium sp. IB214405]|uniref:right-handed parallel beta-helix repeat-containing protein n=1 Tax=Draconibacterium sp. IB214405 TaxID=3097352 RepID=UPI002A0B085C|nr:right-handed parallel beta-helix repeat-containing protein [Draconibacterium sp. IB214405]MDX8338480.1 right-handed parallel beta-helix repeat-containing protein [Draconibacterium sp. IB214405]
MVRYLLQILAAALVVLLLFSCEDEGYMSSTDAQLNFSVDTVTFDTIFTTIGSTTRRFTVQNPYDEDVLISRIRLAGGDASNFKLNINGYMGSELYEVALPAKDSIFIFVEVTIDPNGQNLPMVVQDSIEFTTNTNFQSVLLEAYGQDFKLIKSERIKTTTWTAEKPYLVYDYAYVDSTETLTIEPGTKIYFHKDAGLYVRGNLVADGTFDSPIIMRADRLEPSYENIPDQWNGVVLYSGSHNNLLNFVTIKNANIGLQVGTIENEGYASLQLSNSRIENMAYAGLFALKSKIFAYNDVIANCGYYAAALLVGGEYEFYHTTIANYWGNYGSGVRTTPSLVISNVLIVENSNGEQISYNGDLAKATFGNSIIYGNIGKEMELGNNNENTFNYLFDHCIIQAPDTLNVSDKNHYINVMLGSDYEPEFIDPYNNLIYELDTLSAAKDIGTTRYSEIFPIDLLNKSRTADDGPDLGAYERIEK